MGESPSLIAAAIVTVIAALGGVVVQIINAASAAKDRRDAAAERLALSVKTQGIAHTADETAKKADVLIESTAKIHELTNSTNSNLQKALEVAMAKITGLQSLVSQLVSAKAIADIQATAAAAATTAATVAATTAAAAAPALGPVAVKVVNDPTDAVPVTPTEKK